MVAIGYDLNAAVVETINRWHVQVREQCVSGDPGPRFPAYPGGCPFQRPPDSAKPPIGHKLRDGRQEALECDGIGRFELRTGLGGVDDEVTESEKGGKDNGNQDGREWS